jgi:hypothetical protein
MIQLPFIFLAMNNVFGLQAFTVEKKKEYGAGEGMRKRRV